MHEAWIQFLVEHPTRGGLAEKLIFEAGFKAGQAFDAAQATKAAQARPDWWNRKVTD
jgi:hypothetical protein